VARAGSGARGRTRLWVVYCALWGCAAFGSAWHGMVWIGQAGGMELHGPSSEVTRI
jgi:NADH:ubiquinone oxidoreductase subunit